MTWYFGVFISMMMMMVDSDDGNDLLTYFIDVKFWLNSFFSSFILSSVGFLWCIVAIRVAYGVNSTPDLMTHESCAFNNSWFLFVDVLFLLYFHLVSYLILHGL